MIEWSAMNDTRTSGILLHITSLPGDMGIGDLGHEAYKFVDFLVRAGQKAWQVLPLGPVSYGNSPYQSPSSFAGNPLMISPVVLMEQGLLHAEELGTLRELPRQTVDYSNLIPAKNRILRQAFARFEKSPPAGAREKFEAFLASPKLQYWLPDFALFAALKLELGECNIWYDWGSKLSQRDPKTLEEWRRKLAPEIRYHSWLQFQFTEQWLALKKYANGNGVKFIGDTPIFVALDSSDTWSHPELFQLDERRRPTHVAGVPPDYFSEDGQLWGNPLYRWEEHQRTGFRWWIERVRYMTGLTDFLRIDHFRGFEAYWEVPADAKTAKTGRWVKAPGDALFSTMLKEMGPLPLIAEDLGVITPEMEALRDKYELPGMRVLQFAFSDDAKNPFLPHNYVKNTIVYTGTHDNDTTNGWWNQAPEKEKQMARDYLRLPADTKDVAWEFIRAALASTARTAIFPMQDALALDSGSRMNLPGRTFDNWAWRIPDNAMSDKLATSLLQWVQLYGR